MRGPDTALPLQFDRVSLSLGGVDVITDLTLTLAGAAPVVLIGPNGAGKSTLLRLAMGLVQPTRGQVTWGGLTAPSERLAIVFQRPVMLRRSARANIDYVLDSSDQLSAAVLLERVGLAHVANRPARRLSGGEQQRLALARALARNPEILLLDEPSASLDPAATKALEDILREVAASGVKIVMSTHDIGQARRIGAEVVFLVRGRAIEHGPAAQFFSSPASREATAFLKGELVL
jgi:tungstate transport system ATP-binding protein